MSDTWDSAPLAPAAPVKTGTWDSAPLADPTTQQKAVVSASDNGEEAARALAVGKKTGIPATVVQSDLPGYDAHMKQQSAIKAVQNPALAKYIDGNPMAARVSGDDYDELERSSKALNDLNATRLGDIASMKAISRIGAEFKAGAEEGAGADTPTGVSDEFIHGMQQLGIFHKPGENSNPFHFFNESMILPVAGGINSILRSINATIYGAAGAAGQTAVELGGSQGTGQQVRREAINFAGYLMANSAAVPGPKAGVAPRPVAPMTVNEFLHAVSGRVTKEEIDAFLKAKPEHGPVLQITKAEVGSEALDRAVEVAQDSKTKVRAPELFEEAAAAHDPGNVHIDAGKILELYEKEGKVPAEGDGLLGFVPGIAEQAQAAAATGGEVTIPVSKYIAHVDPAVHEGLKESVRLHDNGVTLAEAEAAKEEIKSVDKEAPIEPEPTDPVSKEIKYLGLSTKPFMNMLLEKGEAVGITENEIKKYSDLIARQEQAVLDRAVSVSKAEVAQALTTEWKRNEAAVTTEVTEEFRTQGVFAAERYLRQNKIELGGDNVDQIADDLAPLWGFDSGDALRRALTELETVQAADRKSVQVQEREAIKAAVAARMEERYGNLAENVAKEARQIALADHTFAVLAAEVRILADAAGVSPPLSRAEMVEWAKGTFEASNIQAGANWELHRRAVERGGREAEKALLKGDYQEAFLAKQRQMLAATIAKESLALQKVIDGAEKKIDKFSSEEVIPSIDQDHLEQLRQMLASVGLPQQFAPLANTPALRDFVDVSEGQIAVAPWLMDGSQPKLQDMTVAQFRDFVKSTQSLEHAGRQAIKLENAYGEALLANVVGDIVKSLERFPFIDQPAHPSVAQRAGSIGRKVVGMHLLVERAFDYTDKFDPHGPLTEWVDRPLRDANSKEIALTEQVVKMLNDARQFVDSTINDKIDNNLIPDANDKSGFLSMTRQDLRNLMLNTGNWSNMRKAVEGFGINEMDLRRFIDKNATAKDVAWVNKIWDVFKHLKPEADTVQLRDTGVPVDHIPAVSWEVAGGKLEGGYYPLSYDKYNSDIDSRVARPLFDKGYFTATTPHGYTETRTQYSGALDLTGAFLSAKIQGMVHDIAFREAVRNANKLIENQEFRTAVAQYWGKEVADLLPGWIRDIANSHNLDDNYARGFARAAALVRQNVVSTLIAYNPGTFIKHGFTAAVMSVDRVGLGKLLDAVGDLGWKQLPTTVRELVSKSDRLPDEAFMQSFRDLIAQDQRGENARQFVLDSSAVMRNRQRQYEDSIRGAVDAISNIGIAQTLADFRQRQMQYGRLAVAFSDQMSAMPTWLAAYKKAYQAGETHADAVFIADKEMSRAHGSSFIGDQPLVTRIKNSPTGELARWFVPLYKFWNHQVNNNFQLAWDAAAALGGNAGVEPGANAASISRRVAYVMGIILIEEMASGAKDESHHGLLTKALLASIRYFGAGFVGARELTNGLASGYEPSTGMIGTLFKAGADTVKDIGKATGVKAGIAKDWIKHTATTIGFMTGVGGSQVGRTGQFGANVASGRERPANITDWRQGLRTGSMKARIH